MIVFAYPTYVFHAPASIKNLLEHLGYQWIVHRPNKKMFFKRAVIITQCLGAGASKAIKDVKDSLIWWGIPNIYTYKGSVMDKDINWDNISNKRKGSLIKGIRKTVKKINLNKKVKTNLITKIKFNIVRLMQKSIIKNGINSIDANYWKSNGWLERERPWR